MTKKELRSDIWNKMDNIMYKYVINTDNTEKKAMITELLSLFYNREMYKYYMYKGTFILGQTSAIQITSNNIIFLRNELGDAINDKYMDTIIYTIKKYNGSDSYSKYFNGLFNIRIKDRNIMKILEKYKVIENTDDLTELPDGDSVTKGDIIKGNINYEPEVAFGIKDIIDTQAEMLLLMMCIIKVKTRNAKNTYNNIYEKIYTSDFCNIICKTSEITNYISDILKKRERVLFDFMDLKFMDFFMCNNNRNLKSISNDITKTEEDTGISENKLRLNLPIEQRVYKFYYENILNDNETRIRHRFDKYKEIITDIKNSYKNNHLEEDGNDIIIEDEIDVRIFIKKYIDGNYRNLRGLR